MQEVSPLGCQPNHKRIPFTRYHVATTVKYYNCGITKTLVIKEQAGQEKRHLILAQPQRLSEKSNIHH